MKLGPCRVTSLGVAPILKPSDFLHGAPDPGTRLLRAESLRAVRPRLPHVGDRSSGDQRKDGRLEDNGDRNCCVQTLRGCRWGRVSSDKPKDQVKTVPSPQHNRKPEQV